MQGNGKGLQESVEGVRGIRSLVTFDVTSNSPCVSQGNTRQFGRSF